VAAKEDINGNIQPVKLTGPTTRIDGFAALLCAYKYLMENTEHYKMCIGG
jgi:phage terminase large subunit-like protein